eukprot:11498241-Ditylum_brightwellii.AAC.1
MAQQQRQRAKTTPNNIETNKKYDKENIWRDKEDEKTEDTIQRHMERGGQNQSGYWQDMERNKNPKVPTGRKRKRSLMQNVYQRKIQRWKGREEMK